MVLWVWRPLNCHHSISKVGVPEGFFYPCSRGSDDISEVTHPHYTRNHNSITVLVTVGGLKANVVHKREKARKTERMEKKRDGENK